MNLLRLAFSLPTALALAVSCGSSLTAQGSQPPILMPSEHAMKWPQNLGFDEIRRVEGLFWDSPNRLSAIGVRGVNTAHAPAPAITPALAAESFGAGVVDMVRMPGVNPLDNEKDGLLLTTVNGTSDVQFAYADATGNPVVTDVIHTGWNRAGSMQYALAVGGIDIAAISYSGTTLLRTYYDYQSGTFTQAPSLVLNDTIHDICIADFNVDGINDVAVLTDTSMTIYDAGGTQLQSEPVYYPGGAIEEVPQLMDRSPIAFLRRNIDDTSWELLHVTMQTAPYTLPSTDIAINGDDDFTLVHMESGDADMDSDFDIVIQGFGRHSVILKNDSSPTAPQNFDGATAEAIEVGEPSAEQGPASIVDYDYDGSADMLVPVEEVNGHRLILVTGLAAKISPADSYNDPFTGSDHLVNPDTLKFRLLLEDDLEDFTHATITVYSGDDGTLANDGWADPEDGPYTVTVSAGYNELLIDADLAWIDTPKLMLMTVQLSSDQMPRQKPTFIAACTIDTEHTDPNVPPTLQTSFLDSNMTPGAIQHDIKRPMGTGRVKIGLIGSQRTLPFE